MATRTSSSDVNILQTGDLLFNGTYPLIDYSTVAGSAAWKRRKIAC